MSHGADPVTGALGPWSGGRVSERATCVLAPNAGPMTLDGTNTWVLHEPGSTAVVVVDPGPDDAGHLEAIQAVAGAHGRITRILLTHGHPDHAEGARSLAVAVGAPVLALDPAQRLGSEGLGDGDVLDESGLVVRVIGTPGHTADSLSFLLDAEGALLTGDTVLGRGTTVVMHPDGRVSDYLGSLRRLRALAESSDPLRSILPGHGPVLDDPARVLAAYEDHRRHRLAEVAAALTAIEQERSVASEHAGADAPVVGDHAQRDERDGQDDIVMAIVRRVYAQVPREVWPAAALSVAAQVEYLRER